MKLIQKVEIGSTSSSTISFTNIPQDYRDLFLIVSLRSDTTGNTEFNLALNGTAPSAVKWVRGNGSAFSCGTSASIMAPASGNYAATFGVTTIYIPEYASTRNKVTSIDVTSETNAQAAGITNSSVTSQYNVSSGVTSITLSDIYGSWVQYSSVSLYGIDRVAALGKPKATGGVISYANNRWFHTFTSSGTFNPLENLNTDYLVVAGGGASAKNVGRYGGGGGAGGYLVANGVPLTKQAYSVIVGAGGTGALGPGYGGNGADSTFLQTTATGGGAGGAGDDTANRVGRTGGSGGGGTSVNGSGGAGVSGQGYAGGSTTTQSAAGGGGAGGVGGNETSSAGGAGGPGLMWIDGNYYAGGGAGGGNTTGYGGSGGGGNGSAQTGNTTGTSGAANTGGGAGGAYPNQATIGNQNGNNGGSGVVIISYPAN